MVSPEARRDDPAGADAVYPRAVTVAGSDSSGGAGTQADLKTFSAFGVYGACVVTAVTAQNTHGIAQSLHMPPDLVRAQLDAVLEDIGADAAKTGMLGNAAIVRAIAESFREKRVQNLVVDPVLHAKNGTVLLDSMGLTALRDLLLPLAVIITPNAPEAAALAQMPVENRDQAREAARRIAEMGCRSVLITAGHLPGEPADVFYHQGEFAELKAERVPGPAVHGTGCTFSAAIAALLALGRPLRDAVLEAHGYLQAQLRRARYIGGGFRLIPPR
jgi:hydroxymethylpyrimidine/phosphomethylpyrimidine kinase